MTTGSVLAQFTITLTQAASEPVLVDWYTSDGTAKAGVDYAAGKGTATFAPGETSKTISILVYGRAVGSEDRSFFVEMLPPVNAILGASIGECIITVDTTGSTPVTAIIVPTGPRGLEGKSAYQVWLDLGNTGTEQDFIDSLSPSPEEIAEEVAPLLNMGESPVTAEGTSGLSKPDTMKLKALARRVAYVGAAKIATVTLADGDNLIAHSDLAGDTVDFASVGLYPRIMRGSSFVTPAWWMEEDGRLLIKSAVAGDMLYVCQYDTLSAQSVINTCTPITRQSHESLSRSYAKAGYNLRPFPESFLRGGRLLSPSDVLLDWSTGIAYSGSGPYPQNVLSGTSPASGGFTSRARITGSTYAGIRAYSGNIDRIECIGRSTVFDGASGVFALDSSDNTTPDDDGYCLVDALGRRWKRVGFAVIDPVWYGAVSDYDSTTKSGTSSSAAFFKAVSLAAAGVDPSWQDGKTFAEVCKVVRPKTGNYKFTSSVPIPSGVIVDINNSLIGGDGFTDADCEAFVTGYIDTDGVLKSNLALGDEVGRVIGAKLINWRAKYLKKFFHAKNFNEGSVCENGYASDVQQAVKGRRCFYGAVRSCVSRGAAGGTLLPAFDFDQFVNIMDLDGLVATSRENLQRISGGANALHVRNQAYESGGTGFVVNGEVRPSLFSCNYFEGLTVKGLDMSDPSTKQSVVVDNNWFYSTPIAIHGASLLGGRIGCGNYFLNCGINVQVNDNVSTVTVDIPPSRVQDTAGLRPVFPTDKYVLGQAVDVRYRVHNYSSVSGESLATQNYAGDRPMNLPYSGRQGYVPGRVAFCDTSKTAGTSFSVIVDTKINYDKYVSYIFTLEIADNSGVALLSGRGVGSDVYADKAAGRTITASNNGGYLRLTIPGFSHPTGFYSCEGVVRHT